MAGVGLPWNVWNSDRSLKESITASSLQELIEKGCSKLGLSPTPQLRVVLEEDGTEVDEEEYFSFLPGDTTFLFLQNNELKRLGGSELEPRDETDASSAASVDEDLARLTASLRSGLATIMTFSPDELQKLVDQDMSQLAELIGERQWYAHCLQAACQRHLDALAENDELDYLLKLYPSNRNSTLDEATSDKATLDEAALDEAALDEATLDEAALDEAALDTSTLDKAALEELALDELALDWAI